MLANTCCALLWSVDRQTKGALLDVLRFASRRAVCQLGTLAPRRWPASSTPPDDVTGDGAIIELCATCSPQEFRASPSGAQRAADSADTRSGGHDRVGALIIRSSVVVCFRCPSDSAAVSGVLVRRLTRPLRLRHARSDGFHDGSDRGARLTRIAGDRNPHVQLSRPCEPHGAPVRSLARQPPHVG